MYAVIDLETTGLSVSWSHRICEIAIVRVDELGRIVDEWCSLVNPERDLGFQALHGISAASVRRAPRFSGVAGEVAQRLVGRIVVAHNLVFDVGFLKSEFVRMGYDVPLAYGSGLCTMRLAADFLPHTGRSLADCCRTAGIEIGQAHSALHDARAAAKLLGFYISQTDPSDAWGHLTTNAGTARWPHIPLGDVTAVQRGSSVRAPEHFLARLVERLPRVPVPPQADQYLSLLDTVLVDRHISETEADALVDLASAVGLHRADLVDLHRQYLQSLSIEALDDGVVTNEEFADLVAVAELLGLSERDVSHALHAGTQPATRAEECATPNGRFRLAPGETVVFTGQTEEPREVWVHRALQAGLTVGRSVTKTTRLLVAADPDTFSGKARQARRYQIPIIRPVDFSQKIKELTG